MRTNGIVFLLHQWDCPSSWPRIVLLLDQSDCLSFFLWLSKLTWRPLPGWAEVHALAFQVWDRQNSLHPTPPSPPRYTYPSYPIVWDWSSPTHMRTHTHTPVSISWSCFRDKNKACTNMFRRLLSELPESASNKSSVSICIESACATNELTTLSDTYVYPTILYPCIPHVTHAIVDGNTADLEDWGLSFFCLFFFVFCLLHIRKPSTQLTSPHGASLILQL